MRVKLSDMWLFPDRECTPERIQKIKAVHTENPHYTVRELMMVCYESHYMVIKYLKMIKTV